MRRLAFLLLTVTSCAPPEAVHDPKGPGDDTFSYPIINIDPAYLDFGTVASTDPAEHSLAVRIDNGGDSELHLSSMELSNPGAPFLITDLETELVQPGGSTTFSVDFNPVRDGAHEATLAITSDDPTTPVARLPLMAEGLAPSIALSPDPLDFGTVNLGCAGEATLLLDNEGSLDLTVMGLAWHHQIPAFTLAGTSTLPFSIAPGGHVALTLSFEPSAQGVAQATLGIASDDPANPRIQVALSGTGAVHDWNTDTYAQRGTLPSDVLIAVNTNPSMEPYAVADQLTAFATEAFAAGGEPRIALTMADDGCLLAPWIDTSTADIPAAMAAMLAGPPGSNAERTFMLLEAALTETLPGGCNEGLLREDSRLMLVGVSDEVERSGTWSYYTTLFQSWREDPDDVVISAVGGDYPSGCGDAAAYIGMYEATRATDGLFLSICEPDWGAALAPIASAVDGLRERFPLSEEPVPDTITVSVDGLAETRWSYDAGAREVVFEAAAVPGEGATVEIGYAVAEGCGDRFPPPTALR